MRVSCDARRAVWCRDSKTRSGDGVRAEDRILFGEMRRGDLVVDDLITVFVSFRLCLGIRFAPHRQPFEGQWGEPLETLH